MADTTSICPICACPDSMGPHCPDNPVCEWRRCTDCASVFDGHGHQLVRS